MQLRHPARQKLRKYQLPVEKNFKSSSRFKHTFDKIKSDKGSEYHFHFVFLNFLVNYVVSDGSKEASCDSDD